MKRNYFQVVVVCFLAVLLAACNNDNTGSNGTDNASVKGESNHAAFSQGVTDKEILIGTSGPQTGPAAVQDAARKGMDAYFKFVNANGGVHGREIKLVSYDDQYQPAKAVQFAKRLADDDKVFLVAGTTGTATNQAAKEIYVDKGMPVLMPASGAKEFVDPPIDTWFGSAWFNYENEAKIMLKYAIDELGAKKIAITYQNDDFGKTPLNAIKTAINDYPEAEIVTEVSFLPTDTDFSSQTKKLADAKPDTILNFGIMPAVVNLKKASHRMGLNDEVNFIVSSTAGNDSRAFDLAGADVWEGTISSDFLISLNDKENEKVKTFLEEFKNQYPNEEVNAMFLDGWGTGQVVVEALQRTDGELTWEKFYEVLNSFDDWDGSVFTNISFSENNHYGITSMYMTKAEKGKINKTTENITFDPESGEIEMP